MRRDEEDEAGRPLLGNQGATGNVPFMVTIRQEGDPRKETFTDMMKFACCPTLTWKSFTAFITIVDIVMYIITLSVNGGPNTKCLEFLCPKGITLDQFGERDNSEIKYNYELWRFITPIFLHAHFLHIFFNAASQLMFGSQVELMLGSFRLVVFYILCGVGGNVLGGLITQNPAVGASTSISGFLGLFVAYLILNWKRLSSDTKCFLGIMIGYIVMMNLLLSLGGMNSQSRIDNAGHVGGMLTGVFLGMFILTPRGDPAGPYEQGVRKWGYGLTAVYFITCFLCFFLVLNIPPV